RTFVELERITFFLRYLRTQGRLDGHDRHSTASTKEDGNLQAVERKRPTKSPPITFEDDGACKKRKRMHEVLGDPYSVREDGIKLQSP
ncbi:hypothetical protein KIN20_017896, partial [Parelaphostrongylus tenuis]